MIGGEAVETEHRNENPTHGSPCGNKIDLVENVNKVLVRLFLPQVLDNRLTPGTEWIPSIEHVNDDIGRVENLVQFSPYTTRGTFLVDGLSSSGGGGVICVCWVEVGIICKIVSSWSMWLRARRGDLPPSLASAAAADDSLSSAKLPTSIRGRLR